MSRHTTLCTVLQGSGQACRPTRGMRPFPSPPPNCGLPSKECVLPSAILVNTLLNSAFTRAGRTQPDGRLELQRDPSSFNKQTSDLF